MWVFGGNILKVFKSIGKNSVLVKTMTMNSSLLKVEMATNPGLSKLRRNVYESPLLKDVEKL